MGQTVLVVDDDAELRDTISEYLRVRGFEVLEAGNGLDALMQIKRARPAHVILDLMMPRLGGLEALRRIRGFDPTIAVIVITGVEDTELRRQALSLGAAAVLRKPFTLADLLAALRGRSVAVKGAAEIRVSPLASPPVRGAEATSLGRVLVVDDEPDIRSLLQEYLVLKGYEVLTAADGERAVQVAAEEVPDVVFLDIDMPRLNGIEALTKIRALSPDVKVIMMSGKVTVEVAKLSLAYGAFDYLPKPLDFGYLLQSLETALLMKWLDAG